MVQGFGNAGSVAALAFHESGAKILAVSDSQGGIHSPEGLDVQAAIQFKREHGSVVGLPGTKTITNEELLAIECDVLIPAAFENQIHRDNAATIRARLICEAANGPTTPAADDQLCRRGIPVLPDILANAGGVTVSYFEWVQNIENEQWDLNDVNRKLRRNMQCAVVAVVQRWRDLRGDSQATAQGGAAEAAGSAPAMEIDLRTAALVVAIDRVSHVALERGIWP